MLTDRDVIGRWSAYGVGQPLHHLPWWVSCLGLSLMVTIVLVVIAYTTSGTMQSVLIATSIGITVMVLAFGIGYLRRPARAVTITERDINFHYPFGTDEWPLEDVCLVDASDFGTNRAPFIIISFRERRGRRHRMPILREEAQTLIDTILECAPNVVIALDHGEWLVPPQMVGEDGRRALRAMIWRQAVVLLWATPLLVFFATAGVVITTAMSPNQPMAINRIIALQFASIVIIAIATRFIMLGCQWWRVNRLRRSD